MVSWTTRICEVARGGWASMRTPPHPATRRSDRPRLGSEELGLVLRHQEIGLPDVLRCHTRIGPLCRYRIFSSDTPVRPSARIVVKAYPSFAGRAKSAVSIPEPFSGVM